MVSTSIQNEHLHELETEQKPQAVIRAEAAGLPSSRSFKQTRGGQFWLPQKERLKVAKQGGEGAEVQLQGSCG